MMFKDLVGWGKSCGTFTNGILLSHKQEGNLAICVSMVDPESIVSEISQSEEDKYHMISLKCGIYEQIETDS